jgi:hypothetical protein
MIRETDGYPPQLEWVTPTLFDAGATQLSALEAAHGSAGVFLGFLFVGF